MTAIYTKNDVIERMNAHNDYCYKVSCMLFDAKCEEPRAINRDAAESMVEGNIETGIDLCCMANEVGLNACVDMIWGYILPYMDTDDERYKRFCYAD